MSRWFAALALITVIGVDRAQAQTPQESTPGPGTFEVTIFPGGATFFTEASDSNSPSFGNYDLGGSATVNFNRFIGVEGEVSGLLGVSQSLDLVTGTADVRKRLVRGSVELVRRAPTRRPRRERARAVRALRVWSLHDRRADRRSRRPRPPRPRGRRPRRSSRASTRGGASRRGQRAREPPRAAPHATAIGTARPRRAGRALRPPLVATRRRRSTGRGRGGA